MEVKNFIQALKKQHSINPTFVRDVKKKYLSLYRANMLRLYDKGYISDPTCYNEKEIRKNIIEYKISGMIRTSGKVVISSEQVGFALAKGVKSSESREFLSILRDVLYYREKCHDIDSFYDACGLSNVPDNKKVSFGISYTGSQIYTRKPYNLSEAILECFFYNRAMGKCIKRISLKEEIFNKALEILGIPDDTRDGLFVKGMSRKDEITYCNLIFDGLVTSDGVERAKLEKWLINHIWNPHIDPRYRYLKTGLYEYITTQEVDFMLACQKRLLNNCLEEYGTGNVLFLTTYEAYCLEDIDTITLPISVFVIFAENDDKVTAMDRNTLEGYSGEVYSVDNFSQEESGYYVGCPIELYSPDTPVKKLYVDIEQTSYFAEGKVSSWFVCDDDRRVDFDKSFYKRGFFKDGSYEDAIFKALGDADEGNVVGRVKSYKTLEEKGSFFKAKEKVYEMVIKDQVFQNRKAGLLLLKEGHYSLGKELLSSQFSVSQIETLYSFFKEGYSFDQIWEVAMPVLDSKTMKNLMRGIKK